MVYWHEQCGTATQVPDEIARDIRLDPCYHSSMAICVKCGAVPEKECILESGVRLNEYRNQILCSKGTGYHLVRRGLWIAMALIGGAIGLAYGLAGARLGAGFGGAITALLGIGIGALAGLLWGHIPRLWMCKQDLI